jgi:hypothetical protein
LYLNRLHKGLIISITFHLFLFGIVTRQFSQTPLRTIKKDNQVEPIQARLYFPQIKSAPTKAVKKELLVIGDKETKNEKINHVKRQEITSLKKTLPPLEITEKANSSPEIFPKQQVSKKVLTSETSKKGITQSSLEKLKNRLSAQIQKQSKIDNLHQYFTDKNTISPSITKFNQLPIAKAKIKEVDCNTNSLNIAVTAISGLLGGSVRCNSMPNLKRFLDDRAK